MDHGDVLRFALDRHRSGDLREAERIYRCILAECPSHEHALEGLGVLLTQSGKPLAAIECLRQALRIDPELVDAHRFLATALLDSGQSSAALAPLEALVRLCPDDAAAWNNLGAVQATESRRGAAEASFRKALDLQPQYRQAIVNLANAIVEPGREGEVAALCRRAIALMPDDDPTRFLLSAVSGETPPPAAPAGYLTSLFDNSATIFDAQADRLNYRGPQMLRDAFDIAVDPSTGLSLDIADLGCGTGLSGAAFCDLARTLTGIDLSVQMLEQARSKGIYSNLIAGEIADTLKVMPHAFDMVISMDVFIYIGNLSGIFASIWGSLRPDGLFAFGVESAETADYVLRRTRRYAHSAAYVRRLAKDLGFIELTMRTGPLRTIEGNEIEGATFVFRRPH